MPLLAVALALSTLVHAALPVPTGTSLLASEPGTSITSSQVVFEPIARPESDAPPRNRWVAPHVETPLWSAAAETAADLGTLHQWAALQVVGKAQAGRLPVWDPSRHARGWVQAPDVGPIDPALVGTAHLPPMGRLVAWSGPARVTMYTCVELGGCAPTASGIWPEPGMVAVDPRVIPLGSTVWIQGVGTFLATDTGSLVRGAHLDIFSLDYQEAITWGVQQRTVQVFVPN